MASDERERRAQRLTVHLRQSVNAARALSFAAADVSGKLGGAVNAAASLAENLAKASKNAKLVASATGIGAAVAVLASLVAMGIGVRDRIKDINDQMRQLGNETAIINAKAAGNLRLQTELEIASALEDQTVEARSQSNFILRRLGYEDQLIDKLNERADAARRAAVAETDRAFTDKLFDLSSPSFPTKGTPQEREANRRLSELQHERERRSREVTANREGFDIFRRIQLSNAIQEQFDSGLRELYYDLEAPSRQLGENLGRSITGGIADGIAEAVRTRSFSEGFRSLTGSILIGFGEMMQEIGTQSLLAAQLLARIVAALRSFAPEGAIGASLLLIAAGGVLKGVGASMGGRGGGGGRSYGGYGSGNTMTYIGVVPPSPAPNVGGLAPVQPVNLFATFIGARDPKVQRDFLELMRFATARGGV